MGDFRAVSSDVLNGRAADKAWDSGEGFESCNSLLAEVEDKGVPVGSGGDLCVDFAGSASDCDGCGELDVQHHSGEARVWDEEI